MEGVQEIESLKSKNGSEGANLTVRVRLTATAPRPSSSHTLTGFNKRYFEGRYTVYSQ